jgi:hypothetical protein
VLDHDVAGTLVTGTEGKLVVVAGGKLPGANSRASNESTKAEAKSFWIRVKALPLPV